MLPDEIDVLTITEVARRLRVSRNSAYELARLGRIPGVLRLGRTIRVSRTAFDDWLAKGEATRGLAPGCEATRGLDAVSPIHAMQRRTG
jgi:excisionase family DNA binding protein